MAGLLYLVLCAGAAGYIADSKGRDKVFWAIMGVIFGIFAVLVIYLISGSNVKERSEYRDWLEK